MASAVCATVLYETVLSSLESRCCPQLLGKTSLSIPSGPVIKNFVHRLPYIENVAYYPMQDGWHESIEKGLCLRFVG